jgi:hypothetical protein
MLARVSKPKGGMDDFFAQIVEREFETPKGRGKFWID